MLPFQREVWFVLFLVLAPQAAHACSCIPGSFELETSLSNNDAAAKFFVSREITPKRENINEPRYWSVTLRDVFKGGCTLETGKKVVIRTGGNSALCGAVLKSYTPYLLIGRASIQSIPELNNYNGPVLQINSCTLQAQWASLTKQQLSTLYALEEETCGLDCDTCPLGYFDGCNNCFCSETGGAGCTRRLCAPGTETEPYCKCKSDTQTCSDGSSVERDPLNDCAFKPCPVEPPKGLNCAKCPLGYFDGCNECFCDKNTGIGGCTEKFCPPGTETEPFCKCSTDSKPCPDGSSVSRDPFNDCEFKECPKLAACCDPLARPGFGDNPICFEGTQCCPDGKWSCSIGDGKSFPCGEEIITEGFGKPCDVPIVCPADVQTCPDGSVVSRDPLNNCQFKKCPKPAACCDPVSRPGFGDNPICFEGVQCCPDGKWSCSIGDGKSFPCGGEIITEGFGKPCDVPIVCPADVQTCPDGSVVSRDPLNNCQFKKCPKPAACCDPTARPGFGGSPFCTDGSKCCPDGKWSCSIGDGISFPCGGETITEGFGEPCDVPVVCEPDSKKCPDGSEVVRDPENNCLFAECEQVFCTADVKTCPDGSFVSRDPEQGCAFEACPPLDCEVCPFGYFDGCNACGCQGEFAICTLRACQIEEVEEPKCNPKPEKCEEDAKVCYDGSSVSRDPNNGCEFSPCPVPSCKVCPFGYNDGCNDCKCNESGEAGCTKRLCLLQGEPSCAPPPVICTADVFECPDGSFVSRDPKTCEFEECPIPDGCPELDGCHLVNLKDNTEVELEGEDSYKLVDGVSEYSIYCEAEGHLDQVTFYYPNGAKDRHVEWGNPWYMRGDSGGWINRVPYLANGCGPKKITVEGRTWRNVCFSETMELNAIC